MLIFDRYLLMDFLCEGAAAFHNSLFPGPPLANLLTPRQCKSNQRQEGPVQSSILQRAPNIEAQLYSLLTA